MDKKYINQFVFAILVVGIIVLVVNSCVNKNKNKEVYEGRMKQAVECQKIIEDMDYAFESDEKKAKAQKKADKKEIASYIEEIDSMKMSDDEVKSFEKFLKTIDAKQEKEKKAKEEAKKQAEAAKEAAKSDTKTSTDNNKTSTSKKSSNGSSAASTASTPAINVSGATFTAIGDSVMLGAKPTLQSAYPGAYIDASVSRQLTHGISIVNSLKASGGLSNVVIIALGTNSNFASSKGQELIDAIGPDKQIYWVGVYGTGKAAWVCNTNSTIQGLCNANSNVTYIDWPSAAAAHPEWIGGDGVHPTVAGQKGYVATIQQYIH